jgi:hypothetical protein
LATAFVVDTRPVAALVAAPVGPKHKWPGEQVQVDADARSVAEAIASFATLKT